MDDYFATEGIDRLDYLKIDTEGTEASILVGARNTIRKFRPCIQVEIAEQFSDRQPNHKFSIKDYLSQLGYQMFKIDSKSNVLTLGISWNTIVVAGEKIRELIQKGLLKN